ncbi:MAG: hypothetical protein ACFFCM_19270 [Promethearchaeota archaeon]
MSKLDFLYKKNEETKISPEREFFLCIFGVVIALLVVLLKADEIFFTLGTPLASGMIGVYVAKFGKKDTGIVKFLIAGIVFIIALIISQLGDFNYLPLLIIAGELVGIAFQ